MQPSAVAESALLLLKKNGAQKAQVDLGLRETHEINVEAGRMNLLRSTFDQGVSMRVVNDHRQSVMSGNQFNEAALSDLAKQVVANANASPPDEAFDIAPPQPPRKFSGGLEKPNIDLMFDRTEDFLKITKSTFPKTILEAVIVKFARRTRIVLNTNGVDYDVEQGDYEFTYMFTSKEGKKTSSFNYNSASTAEFEQPILEAAGGRELLRQSVEQINMSPVQGKFVGDVIITPHCLSTFVDGFVGFLQTGPLLKKQSPFQDSLGKKIGSDLFTLRCAPLDKRFSTKGFVTGDGHVSEASTIVEKGILKSFVLDQFGAKKLNQKRLGCDYDYQIVEPGQTPLNDMISGVKRGLLLCRFSGGYPASNGDISGVAKNSYLIENGEIRGPVSEVMVSANIPNMLNNIVSCSRESINFGSSIAPWMRVSDVTISGQ